MGLVQKVIEEAGISTITLSPIPDFTASVGAPRVAAISHPMGRIMGPPGDARTQREVLRAALKALVEIKTPGEVVHLPFEWPEPTRQAKKHRAAPPPVVKLIMKKPWLLLKFISGDIPEG